MSERSPPESSRASIHRWWQLAGGLLIVVVVVAAYWPALRGAFILDDRLLVSESPIVQSANGLYRFWFTTEPNDYWPLTNTSFWLEWRLWGANPTGYHVTNLLLHIVAVCLIWAILRKLAIPGAYLAALLFAVHPVNVESVSWIAQRKNTLAMVFFLLAILWYLREEESREAKGEERGLARWYWLSLSAFVLAMLSKGSVAILPVILLIIVWWQRRRIAVLDVARTVPFFLVAIVLSCVNVWFQKHGTDVVLRNADFSQRLAGAGAVVWFYLAKALAPFHLIFIYPNWKIDIRALWWWLPLVSALILTVLLAWHILSRNGDWSRALLFAWLFFCVALIPVLGFIDVGFMQYSLVADHYQQIAVIAVMALAAAGWRLGFERSQGAMRAAWSMGMVAVVGALAFLTWQQNWLYLGPLRLCEATLVQNPDCWPLHNDVGVALRRIGRTQDAAAHYKQALRLNPNFADAHYNYGNLLLQFGKTASAIDEYEAAVHLNPDNASAQINLGSALAQAGRMEEAAAHFEQSLRINADSPIAHNNLANALTNVGQHEQAILHYLEALRLKPDYAEAHNNLAGVFMDYGQVPAAIDHYQQALRSKSSYTEAYANLAKAYAELHLRDQAIATAEKGLELARSQGRTSLAEQIEGWLTEYRSETSGMQKLEAPADAVEPSPR